MEDAMRKSSSAPVFLLSLGGLALGALLATGSLAGKAALAAAGDALVVTGDAVNLRFGPSTNTRVRQRVARDQRVMELQREGDWVRVEIVGGDGREGWIHGSLLAPPGGEPLAAAPAAAAPGGMRPAERPGAAVAAAPAEPAPAPAGDQGARPESTEGVATAPGEVAVIAPEAATAAGEALPAVGQPAAPTTGAPATIEPAAAPPHDEAAELARFRASVDYLNSRALSVAGVDLFTDVEPAGNGVVQVAATEAWSSIPPGGQQSYANTLLDRWAAARGAGGPVSVQIVDPNGQVLLESTRP
jgi:hypothetical protein